MSGRWTLAVDPGRSTGGVCLMDPAGEVVSLGGWARHDKRGLELWAAGLSGSVKVLTDPADLARSVMASVLHHAFPDADVDTIDLRIEEPSHMPGASGASVHRAIGQWEGAFGSEAVLVPYREWVRHHGMRPSDGKAEIRKSVLALAAHVVGGWKAPAAVREAAAEAYLIAHCARGTTP